MRRVTLSRPLSVVALVGRYPTNKLIEHGPLSDRQVRRSPPSVVETSDPTTSSGISSTFAKGIAPAVIPESEVRYPCITLPFATNRQMQAKSGSYDLHVLAMPPAFVLSQDQTLRFDLLPMALKAVGFLTKSSNTHVCMRECSSGSSKDEPTPIPALNGPVVSDARLHVQRRPTADTLSRLRSTVHLSENFHTHLIGGWLRILPSSFHPASYFIGFS